MRRDIAAGLAGLVIACSPSTNTTKVEFPLRTVADSGTVLDSSMAAKARRLAEYVITTTPSMHPGIKWYSNWYNEKGQRAEAAMDINGVRYNIIVGNCNEGSPEIAHTPDRLVIDIFPNIARFIDDGLDDRLNDGEVSRSYTNTIPMSFAVPAHRKGMQLLSEAEIDALLEFYENPTGKR